MTKTYSHLVQVDEKTRRLTIHRIYPNGRQEIFTQTDLPATTVDESKDQFEVFCRVLGENLMLDSPISRKLLGL